ncbi:hypothetical protein PR002_g25440 [Phytophthora rubi]|uniref:Uncharacterized protein n=1 Tax=Phytophthora rubi TaxID=129364 RepID=A0A6A3HZC6_9STRA|nr:hypothetical protein PR002_g25440 [Phytophthora rubi]
MEMPVFLERVGRDLLACEKCCDMNIMLGTAAGLVHLRKMEQFASEGALNGDDGDDVRGDPAICHVVEDKTTEFVNNLLSKAGESGFSEALMMPLRRIVLDYKVVWRSCLGDDEPARVARGTEGWKLAGAL